MLSHEEANLEAGKNYGGAAKFKPTKIELHVSNVRMAEAKYWVNEIANQYADFVISNVNIGSDKISFDIGSPSMEDITPKDIEFRIKEYLEMNIPPFDFKDLKAQ